MEIIVESPKSPLKQFRFLEKLWEVTYRESTQVTDGVRCDVYTFPEDPKKDLAILTISAGKKTPLQRIRNGDLTLEEYLSGEGSFFVTNLAGKTYEHIVGTVPTDRSSFAVRIGETMQWRAAHDSGLVVYEICWPPYQDGRFENLED